MRLLAAIIDIVGPFSFVCVISCVCWLWSDVGASTGRRVAGLAASIVALATAALKVSKLCNDYRSEAMNA